MYYIYHRGRLCRIYDISYEYSPSIFDNANCNSKAKNFDFQWRRHNPIYHYRGVKTLSKLIKNHIFAGTIYEYRYLPTWIISSFDVIRYNLLINPRINPGYCSDITHFLDKIICDIISF